MQSVAKGLTRRAGRGALGRRGKRCGLQQYRALPSTVTTSRRVIPLTAAGMKACADALTASETPALTAGDTPKLALQVCSFADFRQRSHDYPAAFVKALCCAGGLARPESSRHEIK